MKKMLHVIIGPMFALKTTTLLKIARESEDTIIVKHSADLRFSSANVVTHADDYLPAVALSDLFTDGLLTFGNRFEECRAICIDEGHFFENIAETTSAWMLQGKNVTVTTLNSGLFLHPIPAVSRLLCRATKITFLTGQCFCGADATATHRFLPYDLKGLSLIGGSEAYQCFCLKHYFEYLRDDFEKKKGVFQNGIPEECSEEILGLLRD